MKAREVGDDEMKSEMEAVHIYADLTKHGYLLEQHSDRWHITEPPARFMPQKMVGLLTLREARAWADGVESMRFILTHNQPPPETP